MDTIETEIIDKLFLELSQFTLAKTSRELKLEAENKRIVEEREKWQKLKEALANALSEIKDTEINTSNYNHEEVCRLNDGDIAAYNILYDALELLGDKD